MRKPSEQGHLEPTPAKPPAHQRAGRKVSAQTDETGGKMKEVMGGHLEPDGPHEPGHPYSIAPDEDEKEATEDR